MECLVAKWLEKDGANTLTAKDLIRVNDNKPEFGSLMLVTPNVVTINNGFMNKRNKVGFITGRVEDLKEVIKHHKLKEGTDYSEKFGAHHIVTLELLKSKVPENQGYREKINPTTGEILTKNGEDIYWKTEVVSEGSDVKDALISHDREETTGQIDSATEEFTGEAPKKKKKKDKKKNKAKAE
jgi:hypothetical protein